MSPKPTAREARNEPDAATSQHSGDGKHSLRHALGNELAVVTGFVWLALAALRQLSEKLAGDAQTELQSIIALVERVKSSAEQAIGLLTPPAAPDTATKAPPHT